MGNLQKIVPSSTEKSSRESAEASKPTATLEILILKVTVAKPVSNQSEDYGTQEEKSMLLVKSSLRESLLI